MLRENTDSSAVSGGTSGPSPAAAPLPASARRPPRRLAVFVQEPLEPPRTTAWRIGVIADGTTRGGPNGIAEGARRVVECAERCALRGDVALFGAFVLSPQNVARRRRPFFAALHAEFLRLLEEVVGGRALAGIRIEVHGRLDRLIRKGGPAARLAHVLALLREMTAARRDAPLCLTFGVDYDEDAPVALALDVLVRTGMEEPSVLRLSGLSTGPATQCIPTTKLWRDFGAADLDQALSLAADGRRSEASPGFSMGFVEGFVAELSRAGIASPPLRITLPVAVPSAEALRLLEEAAGRRIHRAGGVAVRAALSPRGPRDAAVELVLVGPREHGGAPRDEPAAWIAPGQSSSVFRLRGGRAGDANVHACAPTPEGVMDGLRRALRFHEAHPPLHGAPRPLPGGEPAPEGRPEEVFAAACLSEARSAGLMSGEVDWERQAFGYALTAFAIASRRGVGAAAGADAAGAEGPARTLARVMLALASSDEEITDRVFPGERAGARRPRLAASVEYLIAVLRGERRAAPPVRGAATLEAIARTWERFFAEHAATADRVILDAVRRAAEGLYRANLDELSRGDPLFAFLSGRPSGPAVETALRRAAAPEVVERRIRELVRALGGEAREAGMDRQAPREAGAGAREADVLRELKLLCRLCRVGPSIGAGCALLAVAATEPSAAVPAGGAEALLRVTPLIDLYFRLANDLSFDDATRGDRDDKPSTFTCLLPAGLVEKAREQACLDALRTCRATAAWLRAEMEAALGALSRGWPVAAAWLARGTHAGRRAYEIGHYDRLTRDAWAGIVAESSGAAAEAAPVQG